MKDILDKIKKFYEEKIRPLGDKLKPVLDKLKPLMDKMKPFTDKVVEFVKVQKRYLAAAGMFAVMVVVLVFFTGEAFNAERIAKLNSIEVSGEDYVPDANFEVDAHEDVNNLIKQYFSAYVSADIATLEKLVTPLTDMEKSYLTAMSQFYEEYRNVTCYTKHGLSKDSYIVSVRFDIKFVGQEVTAPSMVLFYVQTNKEGSLYINNLYSDFNMKYSELAINKDVYTALRKYTTQDDYLELYNQVESDFNKLIKENSEIYQLTKRTIPATRQTWEDTVYYVERTEETESTESTQTTETPVASEEPVTSETPAPSEEPAPQPSEEPAPQPSEEPAPVVEKVKVKSTINVRVRSGAGTGFSKIADVYNGDIFVKLGVEMGTDGREWTKIQYNDSTVGYIRSDFLVAVTE